MCGIASEKKRIQIDVKSAMPPQQQKKQQDESMIENIKWNKIIFVLHFRFTWTDASTSWSYSEKKEYK